MQGPRSTLAIGIVIASALAACSGVATPNPTTVSPSAPPAAGTSPSSEGTATQLNQGGQVTVQATWNGPSAGAVFDVKLDTHSVDLDAFDLSDAVIRNDRGETLRAPTWAAPKGGHHRDGTLTFGGDRVSFFRGATTIELVLAGIGGVPERVLRWTIGP